MKMPGRWKFMALIRKQKRNLKCQPLIGQERIEIFQLGNIAIFIYP